MNYLAEIFRFVWPYFRHYRSRLAAGILFGMLFGLSNAGLVWATKTLIYRMLPPKPVAVAVESVASQPPAAASAFKVKLERFKQNLEKRTDEAVDPWLPRAGRPMDWHQVLGGLLFFPLLVAGRGFVGFLGGYCMGWVSERVVNDLRVDVFAKFTGLSIDYFNRSTLGDLTTRVNADTAALQRCTTQGFTDLVQEVMTMVGIVIVLCVIDWQLMLGAIVFLPVCLVPMVVLGRKARRASRASVAVNVVQSSQLIEMLSGIRVIKAFGLERLQLDRFRQLSRELVRQTIKGRRAKEMAAPIIETIAMVAMGSLIVYIAYRQRSVDDMLAFLMGVVALYTPIRKLAALHIVMEQANVSAQRLMQILAEQPTVKEALSPIALPAFTTSLVFEGVSFAYRDQPVLQDIRLVIPRGAQIGIAGESGCGKSTLVNLLFRFYDPTAGTIRIDGHDLRDVSLRDLRQLMALVSQEVVVFDQTVAENIAAGKPDATRGEIEAAARAAYAHDFIQQLPEGYDTRIGERGVTLSGGQRQRISIARAFIRNAPILVLDEATGSLDSQAEAEVQGAIERLEKNRTVLCVAHRLSTLTRMDRIIVLSEGRILEQGSFTELLNAGGSFAVMARKQGIFAPVRPAPAGG
jgi:subfamily B ATP-binding cassette protein MsbA